MKYVTWENVGVDRIGCAWLIRRFVDPKAEFLFIPEGSSTFPQGAEPFDIPGAKLSHHHGHCSFYALLQEYKLGGDPILKRIASIIDEADTVQEVSLEDTAPGLDLICEGIRRISGNDQEALTKGAIVYDALYAALSDRGPES